MNTNILSSVSVLVCLSIRAYGGQQKDDTLTSEVEVKHGLTEKRKVSVTKKLLEPAVKQCLKPVNASRQEHYFLTLPWSDDGFRLLPTAMYFEYIRRMESHKANIMKAVDEVYNNYSTHIEEDRRSLNGTFNPRDYPTAEQFRSEYEFALSFKPVPNAGNWIVDIETKELTKMRAELENSVQAEFAAAAKDLWQRVHKVVKHLHDSLDSYGEAIDGTKRTKTFRDSVVENIVDLVGILPMLNVTGDPNLAKIATDVADRLTRFTAESLRTEPNVRKEVQQAADDILSAMAFYCQ